MVPGQPWQVMPTLPAWQVTQLPRPVECRDNARLDGWLPDDGTAQRARELVSGNCRSAPVAVAWVREQARRSAACWNTPPGRGIPWLVIEPAKAEYQLKAACPPDAEVIRIPSHTPPLSGGPPMLLPNS